MKRAMAMAMGMAMAMWLALGVGACTSDEYGDLDVRTFQLEYIDPGAAVRIIEPYVFVERGGMTSVDDQTRTITVRETPEMLARIGEVLETYDQPAPSVALHFRIIQADGNGEPDSALADIEDALPKDVFRFRNYRQVAEAVMMGREWTSINQRAAGASERYSIRGEIGEVRMAEGGGTVQLGVELFQDNFGTVLETHVDVREGQLLVLGSAQPEADRGALILAVQAELVRP